MHIHTSTHFHVVHLNPDIGSMIAVGIKLDWTSGPNYHSFTLEDLSSAARLLSGSRPTFPKFSDNGFDHLNCIYTSYRITSSTQRFLFRTDWHVLSDLLQI